MLKDVTFNFISGSRFEMFDLLGIDNAVVTLLPKYFSIEFASISNGFTFFLLSF